MKNSGIYCIKNIINGKVYVGSAVHLRRRKCEHIWALRRGVHKNSRLQNAWNKYGEGSFQYTILEPVIDPSCLIAREQFWIDVMQAAGRDGYNLNPTAGSQLGAKRTEAARANMSMAGKLRRPITEETREKLRNRVWSAETIAKRTGWHHSDEAKKRISVASRNCSDETRRKIAAAHTGRKRSAETCAKIGATHKGMKHTEEAKAKMSKGHAGKKLSAEHKAKISAALSGRGPLSKGNTGNKLSAETKAKISAAHLRRRQDKMRAAA
jgi:group I intron endonuclease